MKKPPEWVISEIKRVASRNIENLDSIEFAFEDSLIELEKKRDELDMKIEAQKASIQYYKESVIEARNYLLYLGESWP